MFRANSFHNTSLLQFSFKGNQPPAKKQRAEKREANPVYAKEKKNRKWKDSWKRAASGKEHCMVALYMLRQRMRCQAQRVTTTPQENGISDHRRLSDAQPSSRSKLRTRNRPLCMNTASRLCRQRRVQAKLMEPDLRSCLCNNRDYDSCKQRMPLLRRQGCTQTSNKLGGGGI